MNFMERANNNNNKKRSDDDDYYYGEEDRKTTTTSSSASPQGGGGGMTDHPILLFSSTTNWPNSSSSTSSSSTTTTTAALAPPPLPNLYQQYYNTRGGFIRGTISPSPSQQQQQQQQQPQQQQQQPQQQQQQVDLMDTHDFPSVVVREREHMFDKVVTPSDVGKLNRLVIPKQHAEKYFPLDSSTQDKGLLLNFEDVSTSKLWRFRYSYWNSSQSYVMTKGWSRFVKDKKLDPGDIVSFHRDRHKIDHLFIHCTHRPPPPSPQPQYHHHQLLPFPSNRNININNNNIMNFPLHPAVAPPPRYVNNNSSIGHMGYWSSANGPPGGLFLPAHAATPYRGERDHYYHDPVLTSHNPNYRTTGYNNSNYSQYNSPSGNYSLNDYYRHIHQQQRRQEEEEEEEGSSSSSGMMRQYLSLAGIRELGVDHGQQQQQEVLLHSVPVLVQAAAATTVVNNKRLRLFGVNMDCPISDDYVEEDITILPSTIGHHNNNTTNNNNAAVLMPPPTTSLPHLVQLRLNNNNNINNTDN